MRKFGDCGGDCRQPENTLGIYLIQLVLDILNNIVYPRNSGL